MGEWVRAALDIILIGMVGAGLVQAGRLIKHLSGLQQGRVDMERFVHEFSATVFRAEAGIKGLKHTARESGDDLEKLVEKAILIRDELNFLVGSADKIAERLSHAASFATRPEDRAAAQSAAARPVFEAPKPAEPSAAARENPAPAPSSRAEKELLQALQKLS